MAKAYWMVFYRSVSNPTALAEYARAAGPALQAAVAACSSAAYLRALLRQA